MYFRGARCGRTVCTLLKPSLHTVQVKEKHLLERFVWSLHLINDEYDERIQMFGRVGKANLLLRFCPFFVISFLLNKRSSVFVKFHPQRKNSRAILLISLTSTVP